MGVSICFVCMCACNVKTIYSGQNLALNIFLYPGHQYVELQLEKHHCFIRFSDPNSFTWRDIKENRKGRLGRLWRLRDDVLISSSGGAIFSIF